MDCSMPGFLVIHNHPEFAQTPVHSVGDVIQPSHPSPPAFNLVQHQGLFQWVSSLHSMAKLSASASVEYASIKCIYRNLLAPRADLLSYMLVPVHLSPRISCLFLPHIHPTPPPLASMASGACPLLFLFMLIPSLLCSPGGLPDWETKPNPTAKPGLQCFLIPNDLPVMWLSLLSRHLEA